MSSQLLNHYLHSGRISRAQRGIYRLTQFPPGDHEDLTIVWLWTEHAGVFSHETALSLLDLSDVLPSRIHVSVPTKESVRRRAVPENVVLHFADIPSTERTWLANVPSTTAKRTLVDCAMAGVSPEFVLAASEQAVRRGLVARNDLGEVEKSLRPFRGPP